MSAPTETGRIVAYLSLDDSAWKRSIAEAKRDIASLRAERDVDVNLRFDDDGALAAIAAIRAELAGLPNTTNTNVRVQTNARQASGQLQGTRTQVRLLQDAIILLGAAAVPLAAVGAGIGAGLIPALAATVTGIAGINDMADSGALSMSKYAGDVNRLKGEFTTLKAVTSVPLLDGLHQGMAQSAPLFRVINTDAHVMATQIGQIAGSSVPALLNVLTQLNPLFTTIGQGLVSGARGFQEWASSTDSVSNFVSYVQAELPGVMDTLGQLLQALVHVAEGAGPLGSITLSSLGAVARVINALPVGVLRTIIPLLVAARVSMLAYRGVTAVMAGVNAAYVRAAGTAQVFGASTMAANLQAQAAQAAAASSAKALALSSVESDLERSTSALAAAEAQVAAAATGSAAQRAQAAAALTAAEQQVAADGSRVASARAASIAAATAAETSSKRVVAAGTVAAAGWRAALGPIAALVAVLATLGLAFGSSSDGADDAAAATDTYTESVKQSTDALAEVNRAATTQALSKSGVLEDLKNLRLQQDGMTVSTKDAIDAVNGSEAAYQRVSAALLVYGNANKGVNTGIGDTGKLALDAQTKLSEYRTELQNQIAVQQAYNKAMADAYLTYSATSGSAKNLASSLGISNEALVAGAAAAQQNVDQQKAQTTAMQLASDAAGLLKAAFDRLNGVTLDVSDAKIQFATNLATLTTGLRENSRAWSLNTDAGRKNQTNVNQAIRSAQAMGEAVSGGTKLTREGIAATRGALEQERRRLVAMGASTGAIRRVDQALRGLNKIAASKHNYGRLDTTTAQAQIKDLTSKINAIKQGQVPHLDADSSRGRLVISILQAKINALQQNRKPTVEANTDAARAGLRALQAYLDSLHDKTINVWTVMTTVEKTAYAAGTANKLNHLPGSQNERYGGPVGRAAGGDVVGPGGPTADRVPAMLYRGGYPVQEYRLSDGEFVSNAQSTDRNRRALDAGNHGATLAIVAMAAGGAVGDISGRTTGRGKKADTTYIYEGQSYSSYDAAMNARTRDIRAVLKLTTQIDTTGLRKFRQELDGTTQDARDAFAKLYADVKKAGADDSFLRRMRTLDAHLLKIARSRDRARAALGSPSRTQDTAWQMLENARSSYASTRSGAIDAARGGFNVASAGAGEDGQGVAFGRIQAQARQQSVIVTKYVAGIRKLAKQLNKSATGRMMLKQLIDAGPGAYPQVAALQSAGLGQLTSLIASERTINQQAASLGTFTAETFNRGAVTKARNRVVDLREDVQALDRRAERQGRIIGAVVSNAVRRVRNDIYLDGKKVGSGTRKGNKRNDRRH